MFGRQMNATLGKLHFWLSFIPLNIVFFNMMVQGYAGQHRRIYDPSAYEFLEPLLGLSKIITWAAFVLGAAQLIFLYNFIVSLRKGEVAPMNPWEANTLEWTIENPIPHGNFATIPQVYNDPYEYSNPRVKDRDWLAQSEPLPPES
jgi:cytochrome c oxidase subunit 1